MGCDMIRAAAEADVNDFIEVDFQQSMQRLTLDIIGLGAFGYAFNATSGGESGEGMDGLRQRLLVRRCLARIRLRAASAAFQSWSGVVEERKRQLAVVQASARRWKHRNVAARYDARQP